MKRIALATLSVALLLVSASSPALANGTAQGRLVSLAIMNLPDTCPTGATMEGKAIIHLAEDGTTAKKLVTIEVTAETPFGAAPVQTASFRMPCGMTRTIPLDIPVGHSAQPGTYELHFTVSVKGDEVTVDHEVQVFRGW